MSCEHRNGSKPKWHHRVCVDCGATTKARCDHCGGRHALYRAGNLWRHGAREIENEACPGTMSFDHDLPEAAQWQADRERRDAIFRKSHRWGEPVPEPKPVLPRGIAR